MPERHPSPSDKTPEPFDLCVIGGGSAGFGAALAGARNGLRVLLVEKGPVLGGTAVSAGVSTWEPGVGGNGFARELFHRLRQIPGAAGVWSLGRHCAWTPEGFPGGECLVDPARDYDATQRRHGTQGYGGAPDTLREQWHGVVFDPAAYAKVLEELFLEHPGARLWKRSECLGVTADAASGRVHTLRIFSEGQEKAVHAQTFVDASGNAVLCGLAGCERLIGSDGRDAFGEAPAGETADPRAVNAVTLVYRVTPRPQPPAAPETTQPCWFAPKWPVAHIVQSPGGDLAINMLPTMEGSEYLDFLGRGDDGATLARAECERRVQGHWRELQHRYPEFRAYDFSGCAPELGVRETYRVRCEFMLTLHDIRAGLSSQRHPDIIAIADHPLDLHGKEAKSSPELKEPYGIPFRSLIPKGWRNLLVAGRCAGFSHIAASSCRLSRTMMDLGHAAGLAAALALELGCDAAAVPPALLRTRLQAQGADLCNTHPSSPTRSPS